MKVRISENFKPFRVRHRDKYYYILNNLFERSNFVKSYEEDDFLPLNSEILKRILGGRYKEYVKELLLEGYLETDNRYICGEKSMGYRLSERYLASKMKRDILVDKKIIEKVWNFREEKIQEAIQNINHEFVYNNLQKLEIHHSNALNDINSQLEKGLITLNSYNFQKLSIEKIAEKNIHFSLGKKSGRIFHNVSSLKKTLRQYLHFSSNHLVEIDIKNSQPILFASLLDKYCNCDNNNQTITSYQVYKQTMSLQGTTPYVHQKDIDLSYLTADVLFYRKLVEEGTLYDYLRDLLKLKDMSKSELKKHILKTIFYAKNSYTTNDFLIFRGVFPTVAGAIKYFKRHDYRNLPILLQRIEAELMFNDVISELRKKGIYAITIHDSILTLYEFADYVSELMRDCVFRKTGLRARVTKGSITPILNNISIPDSYYN
ncbi:MAG: hypothetical protein K9J12_06220 [Melioribacteraceae bacterium]|nr:hypothetical protein [Melioribacteraceae bacterium]MCF8266129.1 hypothetical protein [Melioribacteraceae bacterium]MCF8432776.1 hypothetical protein [Melioribacteraceae bacterium]